MKKESYIRILPDVIDNDSLEWFAEDYRTAVMKSGSCFSSSFWGEYEKSAIWFKNGDGNWTTSCRRHFNMS